MTEERPLVVVSDESLLDEVLRLAAAVGCETECLPDLAAARPGWSRPPLVIVDEQAARASPDLEHRPGVLLVSHGAPAPDTWQRAFTLGAERVIALPQGESVLLSAFADALEGPQTDEGQVLAVVGGRGGAGASAFAAAAGITVARSGGGALVVDCDPLGGGLDLLLGAEREQGLRWPDLSVQSGRVSMSALRSALPGRAHGDGRMSVISCDRGGGGPTAEAAAAVVDAGRRAGQVVVCDLPRHLGAAGRAVVDRADLVAVLVPAEVRAAVAAKQVLGRVGGRALRAGVVVRGPAPGVLVPEQVAESAGAELLATMPPERGLARALEHGEFSPRAKGPLATAAGVVLAELSPARAGVAA